MASVDETPLSAAPHERRNSLEKHLQMRPGVQDLKDRHILLDTNISPYVSLYVSLVDSIANQIRQFPPSRPPGARPSAYPR